MKKYLYNIMVALLATLALAGCSKSIEEQDSEFVSTLDATKPALVVFAQSINIVSHSTGALVAALNLNAYINAPEEEKEMVEDTYFTYKKICNSGDLWHIYDERWEEKYRLNNSLTLSDEGAQWDIIASPYFLGGEAQDGAVRVERVGKDIFTIKLTDAKLPAYKQWSSIGLRWNAIVNAEFTVTTNDAEQRAAGNTEYIYTVSGHGRLYDPNNDSYSVSFTIDEPIEIHHDRDGMFVGPCYGNMEIEVREGNISEQVSATMSPYYAIMLQYTTMGHTYTGYYNWGMKDISPR